MYNWINAGADWDDLDETLCEELERMREFQQSLREYMRFQKALDSQITTHPAARAGEAET